MDLATPQPPKVLHNERCCCETEASQWLFSIMAPMADGHLLMVISVLTLECSGGLWLASESTESQQVANRTRKEVPEMIDISFRLTGQCSTRQWFVVRGSWFVEAAEA